MSFILDKTKLVRVLLWIGQCHISMGVPWNYTESPFKISGCIRLKWQSWWFVSQILKKKVVSKMLRKFINLIINLESLHIYFLSNLGNIKSNFQIRPTRGGDYGCSTPYPHCKYVEVDILSKHAIKKEGLKLVYYFFHPNVWFLSLIQSRVFIYIS